MKCNWNFLAPSLGAFLLTLCLVPDAKAVCGVDAKSPAAAAASRPASGSPHVNGSAYEPKDDDDLSIVGFWHVKFISEGSGIYAPDGAEIDAGFSQWHSDHTEIMNSGGRSPTTSNFCLGVWQQVGERTYKLNHFATAWDTGGVNLVGTAVIQETVTLDREVNKFSGTFTIDQYVESGNRVAHLQGKITGTRITVNTAPSSIF